MLLCSCVRVELLMLMGLSCALRQPQNRFVLQYMLGDTIEHIQWFRLYKVRYRQQHHRWRQRTKRMYQSSHKLCSRSKLPQTTEYDGNDVSMIDAECLHCVIENKHINMNIHSANVNNMRTDTLLHVVIGVMIIDGYLITRWAVQFCAIAPPLNDFGIKTHSFVSFGRVCECREARRIDRNSVTNRNTCPPMRKQWPVTYCIRLRVQFSHERDNEKVPAIMFYVTSATSDEVMFIIKYTEFRAKPRKIQRAESVTGLLTVWVHIYVNLTVLLL